MAQLVIIVMAIALLALVFAGGVNYLSSDLGVRTDTLRSVQAARHSIETGIVAYRVANRGVLPPAEDGGEVRWKSMLSGYIPANILDPIHGLEWHLVTFEGERALCLAAGDSVSLSPAVVSALTSLSESEDGAEMVSDCDGSAGTAALILPVRSAR